MLLKYIILGIIQGFTEPLPISSSGHLLIFKKIFNINFSDINFEIIINFASFMAISFLYRKKITKLIKAFFYYPFNKKKEEKQNFNYSILIIVGTIPACIIGFILKDTIDILINNTKLIGIAFIITSISLYLIKDIDNKEKNITLGDAIKVGLYQAIALFPGISRSGATIVGASKIGLSKKQAVDYSFMLYLPISIATIILGIKDIVNTNNISNYFFFYTISFIFTMITTYISSKWFINIVKKGKLIYFSIYCLIIGIMTLLFLN